MNKFVPLLTIKRYFFIDQTISVNESNPTAIREVQSASNTENISIVSPFVGFQDQMVIRDLTELQSEDLSHSLPNDHIVDFQIKNPCYYPINSRVPILEDFQDLLERDLRYLNDKKTNFDKQLMS